MKVKANTNEANETTETGTRKNRVRVIVIDADLDGSGSEEMFGALGRLLASSDGASSGNGTTGATGMNGRTNGRHALPEIAETAASTQRAPRIQKDHALPCEVAGCAFGPFKNKFGLNAHNRRVHPELVKIS